MHFAFSNLFRNLRKFRVISKNKTKLSNSKTGLLLELKTYCCLSQNRRAWISSQASGALFAPLFSSSPVISWRTGSVSTSVQTMRNISASKSLISLCLWMINPPCRKTIAWSTVISPHMCTWPVGQRSPSHALVWLHLWILELKIAPSFLYFRSAGLHCFISPRLC